MACSLLSWSADSKCCLSMSTCFCTKSNCLVFSVNRVSAMLVRLLSKSTSFRTLSETNCSQIWFFCRKLWEWWWAWKKKLISIWFRSKSNAWIIKIPTKDSNLWTVCFRKCSKTKWICSRVEPIFLKLCWRKKTKQLDLFFLSTEFQQCWFNSWANPLRFERCPKQTVPKYDYFVGNCENWEWWWVCILRASSVSYKPGSLLYYYDYNY